MVRTACIVCGNEAGNRTHTAREMMFGLRDEFDYVECGACASLQIAEVPPDLGRYYPEDYHSLQAGRPVTDPPPVAWLKRARARHALGERTLLGALAARAFGIPDYYPWFRRVGARLGSRILDVGSGTGRMLFALRREGFTDLTGVEPFIPEDITYPNGIRILKRELSQVEGEYDLAFLHQSFEHMPEPWEPLREIHRLLRPGRYAFLRLPVAGCYAWRRYGVHWVDLDPPRHLFLPSVRGMEILAERSGFRLDAVEFDSTEFQFWASEQYARDIPLETFQNRFFSEEQIAGFRRQAEELNRQGDGDQACFYLYKP